MDRPIGISSRKRQNLKTSKINFSGWKSVPSRPVGWNASFWKNCSKINIPEGRHLEEKSVFSFDSSILFWNLYCKIVETTTISSQSPISMFWKTCVKVRWINFVLKVNLFEITQSFTWIFGRKDAVFFNLNFCWKTMIIAIQKFIESMSSIQVKGAIQTCQHFRSFLFADFVELFSVNVVPLG